MVTLIQSTCGRQHKAIYQAKTTTMRCVDIHKFESQAHNCMYSTRNKNMYLELPIFKDSRSVEIKLL